MRNKIIIILALIISVLLKFDRDCYDENNVNDIQIATSITDEYKLHTENKRIVVNSSEMIKLNYIIECPDDIINYTLSYESSSEKCILSFDQKLNNMFSVMIYVDGTGEYTLKIIALIESEQKGKLCLSDELYIYSNYENIFLSKASMLDAKFYCYEFLTKTKQPSFEDYYNFYSLSSVKTLEKKIYENRQMDAGLQVMGKITWIDDKMQVHDARNITVDILYEDVLGNNSIVKTVVTNENGVYQAYTPSFDILENDFKGVRVRVKSQGGNIKVVNNSSCVYALMQEESVYAPSGSTITINFDINFNNITDLETEEIMSAFKVHQAMNLGAAYVELREGERLEEIKVYYPTTEDISCFDGNDIFILDSDKDDWDVMLHEYGHYVANCYNIRENVGGTHFVGECLNHTNGKFIGMPLAWSEGWATYFSISSQIEMSEKNQNIDNVGDTSYSDPEKLIDYCIENPELHEYRYGESNEICIASALMDLADEKNDDNIYLGYAYVWNLIINNECKNFSEFIQALYQGKSYIECSEYGNILSSFDIAPELSTPINDTNIGWNKPVFRWEPNGGQQTTIYNYKNNLFSIIIYDSNRNIIFESEQIADAYYQIDDNQWKQILQLETEYLYWNVKAYQTTDYVTGPYYSNLNKLNLFNDEYILSNYSSDINQTIVLSDYKNAYYRIIVNYSKYYEFISSGTTNLDMKLYDYNFNEMDITYLVSSVYNEHLIVLLESGIYYLRFKNNVNNNNTISFQIISRNSSYVSLDDNNILINKYNNNNCYIYGNSSGKGFYKFTLCAKPTYGNAIYPKDCIKIYKDSTKQELITRMETIYYVLNATTSETANNLIVFLDNFSSYYIEINLPDSSYSSLILNVQKIDEIYEINMFNNKEGIDEEEVILEESDEYYGDYIQKIKINQFGYYNIKFNYSITEEESYGEELYYAFFKELKGPQEEMNNVELILPHMATTVGNNVELNLLLEIGVYYIGYFNKLNYNPITIIIGYDIQTYDDDKIIPDPNCLTDCGSMINIYEINESDKSYKGNEIVVGFTRILYFDPVLEIESRLDYHWYSSDEDLATVSEFGTVLAKSPGTVQIIAVSKVNPRIVYVIIFNIVDDNDTNSCERICYIDDEYTSSEGDYLVKLTILNCPYPSAYLYEWEVLSYSDTITKIEYVGNGYFAIDGYGEVVIKGSNYQYNNKYSVQINLNVI